MIENVLWMKGSDVLHQFDERMVTQCILDDRIEEILFWQPFVNVSSDVILGLLS